jgi:hypothetical protein
MTGIQRLCKLIFPKRLAAEMESESKSWMLTCECGFSQSIWDMGGVRYKGKGNPRTFLKCPGCKERKWLTFNKVEPPVDAQPVVGQ